MGRTSRQLLLLLVLTALAGCGTTRNGGRSDGAGTRAQGYRPAAEPTSRPSTIAYVDGEAVSFATLEPALFEIAGGRALVGAVLDRGLRERLAAREIEIGPERLAAERARLRASLSSDPDEAVRLLEQLRRDRGLGAWRFRATLRRNAALRALVADSVTLSEADLRQAHRIRYGPRVEARLIVVSSLNEAARIADRARRGASFADLAVRHSQDPSADRGGLLPPVSPADPTWPIAVRDALANASVGSVSDPIALDEGFAVLRVEARHEADPVPFDQVRMTLEADLRARAERVAMQQLAREIVGAANVVVLDATLKRAWEERRRSLTPLP